MANEARETLRARALELIRSAFARRGAPAVMTDSMQLSDAEYEEVMPFDGMR
jgi:hypothetical protein